MKRISWNLILTLMIFLFHVSTFAQAERHMVFTAYQDFISRLYVLNENGEVLQYHEYVNYRLQDMTVIDNELYVSDAFIPCIYRVDIYTGELELVVHDMWLYYFYGVAWDGNYFYVDEWDLNRYDMNGDKNGTADFDQDVMGATFANDLYWMLNDEGEIKCWDFSGWPETVELPEQQFSPPSSYCRGLWYDGTYLWTAESIEGALGKIYQFDFEGEIIEEWLAPAFQGWAACRVEAPVVVNRVQKDDFKLQIFPNPVKDFLQVSLTIEKRAEYQFWLYDLNGKLLGEKQFAASSAGKQKISWDIKNLSFHGPCILRVIAGKRELRQKIIVE